jgi:hypothetical protein
VRHFSLPGVPREILRFRRENGSVHGDAHETGGRPRPGRSDRPGGWAKLKGRVFSLAVARAGPDFATAGRMPAPPV